MLITVQPDPNWQLSLAQLSPSLYYCLDDDAIFPIVSGENIY